MTRILVVGGDAAGASAASQIKRTQPDWDVVMFERGEVTSYAACGLPYWVAGQVDTCDDLIARTPEGHRANGIDVRLGSEAVALNPSNNSITVRTAGSERAEGYDHLVIGTGATPVRPPIPGSEAPNVHAVHTIAGTARLIAALDARQPTRAVIVGAGFVGIEVAEAFLDRDLAVTVVDLAPQPMTSLDPDLGALIAERMAAAGIGCAFGQAVERITLDESGFATAVVTDAGTYPADLVVLALGVRPNTRFATDAGLPALTGGALLTDRSQRVLGFDNIWAAGDAVASYHRLLRTEIHVPLGTHANKQGRVAGVNIAGGSLTFPGVIGTAITKVADTHIARTGLGVGQAAWAGFHTVTATVTTTVKAGYMPDAGSMTTKVIAERGTGRLLGGQIVGNQVGASKRIDTLATAIWNAMTAEELTGMDLSYSPPASGVWDPVQVAARRIRP